METGGRWDCEDKGSEVESGEDVQAKIRQE